MPYSQFPLDAPFDNPTSYNADVTANRFVEGGVDQRAIKGINGISHSRSVSINFATLTKRNEVENFLKTRRGVTPFYYTPFLDATETNVLYTCSDYSFKDFGNETYNFSGVFEQVFRGLT